MDGFKKLPKIQCFKEGGSVQKQIANYEKRERKTEMREDIDQDKAIIKKAFKQHDKAEHGKDKPTEIKLKKGGRSKKDCGTVKKYKTGGAVENVYGAKKTDKDIKDIANAKNQKPVKLCGGKSVKKMADGGVLETLRDNVMGTPAQNATASQKEQAYLKAKLAQKAAGAKLGPSEEMAMGLAGLGQKLQPAAPAPAPTPVPRKKGGKACK
jgi:hypothetical protein